MIETESSRAAAATDRRRRALSAFMSERGLTIAAFARLGAVADSSLRSFLNGATASLGLPLLEKLAAAAGVPVAALIGDIEPAARASDLGHWRQPAPGAAAGATAKLPANCRDHVKSQIAMVLRRRSSRAPCATI